MESKKVQCKEKTMAKLPQYFKLTEEKIEKMFYAM